MLDIPPGFQNIRGALFFVFGALCILGAIQFYFTYPETCGKTLEEIEEMFATGGPHAWKTKPGDSRLDRLVETAKERRYSVGDLKRDMKAGSIGGGHVETAGDDIRAQRSSRCEGHFAVIGTCREMRRGCRC